MPLLLSQSLSQCIHHTTHTSEGEWQVLIIGILATPPRIMNESFSFPPGSKCSAVLDTKVLKSSHVTYSRHHLSVLCSRCSILSRAGHEPPSCTETNIRWGAARGLCCASAAQLHRALHCTVQCTVRWMCTNNFIDPARTPLGYPVRNMVRCVRASCIHPCPVKYLQLQ